MASMPLTLVAPGLDQLESYASALRRGWSPNNVRDVSGEQLAAFDKDPAAFLASLTSRDGRIPLPDGSLVPKLPFILRWLWDGAFCGSISLRWQEGTDALPGHALGHIGYTVVPWKRRRGYATAALAAILPEARRIGLGQVEITCDPENSGSIRVIEANGGMLAGRFQTEQYGDAWKLHYVIPLRPDLATERLTLSPITSGDFDDLAVLTGHPEVGGKLKHGLLDAAETRAQLNIYLNTWAERGFGVFVMRRRDDQAFAGLAGLWDHDDDLGVALRYAVMPEHRGQGYTKEAVRAVLEFAAARDLGPIIAVTRETNVASRKILTDLGFELREIRQRPDRRSVIYSKAQQDRS